MTAALNTLRYANRLKAAGVEAAQAEAMADALDAELMADLATKSDLEQLRSGIEARFDAIDERFEAVERRFDNVDQRFENLDGRFDIVEGRIKTLQFTVNAGLILSATLNVAVVLLVIAVLVGA